VSCLFKDGEAHGARRRNRRYEIEFSNIKRSEQLYLYVLRGLLRMHQFGGFSTHQSDACDQQPDAHISSLHTASNLAQTEVKILTQIALRSAIAAARWRRPIRWSRG